MKDLVFGEFKKQTVETNKVMDNWLNYVIMKIFFCKTMILIPGPILRRGHRHLLYWSQTKHLPHKNDFWYRTLNYLIIKLHSQL